MMDLLFWKLIVMDRLESLNRIIHFYQINTIKSYLKLIENKGSLLSLEVISIKNRV